MKYFLFASYNVVRIWVWEVCVRETLIFSSGFCLIGFGWLLILVLYSCWSCRWNNRKNKIKGRAHYYSSKSKNKSKINLNTCLFGSGRGWTDIGSLMLLSLFFQLTSTGSRLDLTSTQNKSRSFSDIYSWLDRDGNCSNKSNQQGEH